MQVGRIYAIRHPRQRFKKDAPMVFRRTLAGSTMIKRGNPVPSDIPKNKLRRWWDNEVIERLDQFPHFVGPKITSIEEINNSGWYLVKWSNGEEKKFSKSELTDNNIPVPQRKQSPVLNNVLEPDIEERYNVTYSDGREALLTRAEMVEEGIQPPD